MDQQLLREFLADAEDLIEGLSGDIEALRARRAVGRERRALTGRIFRHVHTLKGAAAAVELETVGQLAHEFESLLDGVRLGRVALDDDALEAFADAALALSETLVATARGETPPPPLALLERLKRLSLKTDGGAAHAMRARLLGALPRNLTRSLSAYELERLREAMQDGSRLFAVNINFDLVNFDTRFRALEDALNADGEIVNASPGLEVSRPGEVGFRIIYATEETATELAARVSPFGPATLEEIATHTLKDQYTQQEDQRASAALPEQETASREFQVQNRTQGSIAPLTTHLRIELEELDEAIHAAHELFKRTTATLDLTLSGGALVENKELLENSVTEIRSRSLELEERLIALRMIPVARTLVRASRAGALAARLVGKEVAFEVAGEDVRLDKSLVDAVSDPLLHLVRNAVDHGIETTAERASAGKSERGLVRLSAIAEGSRVRLRISDDGRGIDPSHITRAAREQGIINEDSTLDMREALRLIFRPGFSTAPAVSSVSGRGIGLDVVEHALEDAGGEMRVWSETGAGTTFEILLPTTLALVHSFVVQSVGQRYCLDASHIADARLLNMNDVEQAHAAQVYRWRGARLPLIPLQSLLGQSPQSTLAEGQPLQLVVAHFSSGPKINCDDERREKRTVAIMVDGWDGYQKVLVRGLGRHSSRWHGIGGATELNDGTVALLLDLPRLLDHL
ncbi:MAG: two-component system, chemotaxis family, sensor kinase CheA [Blastocatellia bacterium]|jgi:two-component system chemotaxis sensor kinase CheA|nr:two-component system, chemotaxis family, sensor kinase CheA [Blastocatellia bacterium]